MEPVQEQIFSKTNYQRLLGPDAILLTKGLLRIESGVFISTTGILGSNWNDH